MKIHIKRALVFLLCALSLLGAFVPATTAFALARVNVETQNTTMYFDYLSGSGTFESLKTPHHWVVENGSIAYCLQHRMDSPHTGNGFSKRELSDYYSYRVYTGLQIILQNGYPASTGGLTADQARYATANAFRFWLSENGDSSQYNFTNRLERPNSVRAKSGYQAVLNFADHLVALARVQQPLQHSVSFSPSTLSLSYDGSAYFTGTAKVSLVNCNGGYTLDQSNLPSGTQVSGFSGKSGDMLTIKIPKAYGNQTVRLKATGRDNRSTANMFMYVSDNSNVQNVVAVGTSGYHGVGEGTLTLSTPAYGKIQIIKTDSDNGNRLNGAVFGVYANSACTQEVARLTTAGNGSVTSGDLLAGRYYIKEITAPSGYVVNSQVFTADIVSATYTVTVPDQPTRGRITVEKTNSNPAMGDYSLLGAKFGVYNASGTLVATLTTGADGKGTSADLPLGTYTMKETSAPHGFVLSKESRTVTLAYAGQSVPIVYASASIPNKPQEGTITITKADAETGASPQGDASLYGAKYVIQDKGGHVVDTLHALGTRVVKSKNLPLGNYTVIETQAPEGYLLNGTPYSVTLSYAGQNADVTNAAQTVTDTVKKGRIRIVKFGARELIGTDLDPEIKPPLSGVVFEIRLKSSGVLYDTLTTDQDGMAVSKALPYGLYTVTEAAGTPDGYMKVQPFDVFVSENEKTYHYNLEDKTVEMMIRLVKRDADTGKVIPVAGTTFRIEDSEGNTVSFNMLYPQPHALSEFVTDESGTLYLPGKLAYGSYKLFEVTAPSGYLLNNHPVPFMVDEDSAENSIITVTLENYAAMGRITVEKTGEQLAGFTEKETPYGTQYIPLYETGGLAGVVFEVFAAENVGTPDGTVYYRAGQKVCELTTDANGSAMTPNLHLGKYHVVEKFVPNGFVLSDTPHEVTLAYQDQTTHIVSASISPDNQRQKVEIRLLKMAEYFNTDTGSFYEDYGTDFVFGVYTRYAVGDILADALVDVITTDAEGKGYTTADLPLAMYYVKELSNPYEYIPPTLEKELDLTCKNDADIIFINDDYEQSPIWNDMQKRRVAVIKSDAEDNKRKLPGAVFEVLTKNGRKVVATFTTDENGYGASGNLPLGQYILREKAAPAGFILMDEETVFELTAESKPVTSFKKENTANTVKLTKTDLSDGNPLPGAVIRVEDALGEVVFEGETNHEGCIILRELPAGNYTFFETLSPDGWALNTEVFAFSIDEYGNVTGATEIKNEPTMVIIEKYDVYTDEPIPGVVFGLLDADGNPVRLKRTDGGHLIPADDGKETFAVDNGGKAAVKYLKRGDYTLKETPPIGYIGANSYILTVTEAHSESSPGKMVITNAPTGLKVTKIHADTRQPLTGAGFSFKVKNGLFFTTLRFTQLENGWYKADEAGTVSEMMVDENGDMMVIGLPLGDVWLEETTAPDGYFPVPARKLDITADHTFDMPLTITVENNPAVKLGIDSDKYNSLIAMGICALVAAGVAAKYILWRKKLHRENGAESSDE
ncbi:MAG: SpaA isopeptide-forming pilin-related protein [Christensenellales bacterium]|jgi:uncharacterized surface anchored protein